MSPEFFYLYHAQTELFTLRLQQFLWHLAARILSREHPQFVQVLTASGWRWSCQYLWLNTFMKKTKVFITTWYLCCFVFSSSSSLFYFIQIPISFFQCLKNNVCLTPECACLEPRSCNPSDCTTKIESLEWSSFDLKKTSVNLSWCDLADCGFGIFSTQTAHVTTITTTKKRKREEWVDSNSGKH